MLHNSKFSNKLYTQYQHLFLLVYKQFRKFTYKELLEDLSDNITLRAYLGLNKLPEYTTLIKFAKRLPTAIFDKLMAAFSNLLSNLKRLLSMERALVWIMPVHITAKESEKHTKTSVLKLSIIVDIKHYFILQFKLEKSKTRPD